MFVPEFASNEALTSSGELDGMFVGSMGAENGELWLDILLVPPTGKRGCETATEGVDVGSPGGVICAVWSAGDVDDGIGGLTFCTGNSGCCA